MSQHELMISTENAWTLVLLILVNLIFQSLVTYKREQGESDSLDYLSSGKKTQLYLVFTVFMFISFTYSLFLPLQITTVWFYVGISLFTLATTFNLLAVYNCWCSPPNQLTTSGAYRLSRNPMYLSWLLMFISIGVASTSWLYLSLTPLLLMILLGLVPTEERWCTEKYGTRYQEYMQTTPRWINPIQCFHAIKHIF
jgi:protein-S-isoprenylcysteine O-methyltransferase Ste14